MVALRKHLLLCALFLAAARTRVLCKFQTKAPDAGTSGIQTQQQLATAPQSSSVPLSHKPVGGQQYPHMLNATSPVKQRCLLTTGAWCARYHQQKSVPWKPAPRGSQPCPGGCNEVGSCNHDTGRCDCPAGWRGEGCRTRQTRPCTNRVRGNSGVLPDEPLSFIDAEGRDKDWTSSGAYLDTSRCAGICDEALAMCWCDGPRGRVMPPRPPGNASSLLSPPLPLTPTRVGRPMFGTLCQPKETKDGRPVKWGTAAYASLFGPKGWCVADAPEFTCPCSIDSLAGPTCEEPKQAFCINQCNGHGACDLGFCKCDPGWYGHDCARKVAGQPLEPSVILSLPWLAATVKEAVAALEPPPSPTRKRPLIYVYDLEPLYSSKLLQYRLTSGWCVHRAYTRGNGTEHIDFTGYTLETLLHELLLQSEHRTFDPEEADFFYVPVYSTCLIYPIIGFVDFPWFSHPGASTRVEHASALVLQTKRWIEERFPYWRRRGGRDHVWLFTHDEGACWAPNEITPSIWITHWGKMGLNHTSQTAFHADNYSVDRKTSTTPHGWLHTIQGHACYDPGKDLVAPAFKSPRHYKISPLLGHPNSERDILLFFKGDVGKQRKPHYSRGVRQRLYALSQQHGWRAKHNVLIGDRLDIEGDYSQQLARSKFCLAAPGDGFSPRVEDAILHGCVPVIIMDGVHVAFETLLDWSAFSIRIPEADIDRTLDILLAVPKRRLRSMQAALSRVWHRFRFLSGPALASEAREHAAGQSEAPAGNVSGVPEDALGQHEHDTRRLQEQHLGDARSMNVSGRARPPRPFRGDPSVDDAFSTIVQWLYSRIPLTR